MAESVIDNARVREALVGISAPLRLEPGEAGAACWSFCCFFALLTAYYVIRPVRDELGVVLGPDALKSVFNVVFLIMLAAVPVFGWVVTRFSRRGTAPIVYLFFIADLVAFWALLENGVAPGLVARSFFVWVSVFNLFVISLFWSVMASVWTAPQAKRLYGVIAAGGSAGALTGPLLAQGLVHLVGRPSLLLISAVFLALALLAATRLLPRERTEASTAEPAARPPVTLAAVLGGAMQVWRSPYLMRIAVWVLLANLISTYFYFEQARIMGATIADRTERVQLLARVDLTVSLLTIGVQVFLTARLIERLGIGICAAALPALSLVSFAALAFVPALFTVLAIIVAERTLAFALTAPAARVLWTVVDPDEKYKALSFIDTVVYRGGDAASGWYFEALTKGLGLGVAGIAAVTTPLSLAWLALSFSLARAFARRSGEDAEQ